MTRGCWLWLGWAWGAPRHLHWHWHAWWYQTCWIVNKVKFHDQVMISIVVRNSVGADRKCRIHTLSPVSERSNITGMGLPINSARANFLIDLMQILTNFSKVSCLFLRGICQKYGIEGYVSCLIQTLHPVRERSNITVYGRRHFPLPYPSENAWGWGILGVGNENFSRRGDREWKMVASIGLNVQISYTRYSLPLVINPSEKETR